MPLKALIFDLDDTLTIEQESADKAFLETCRVAGDRFGVDPIELRTSVKEICREFWFKSPARDYCVRIGISSWEGLWARFKGPGEDLRILREWSPKYRKNSWHKALMKHGIKNPEFAVELGELFASTRRKENPVYDDVFPVLNDLKEKYRLGLLTNGAPDLQREKISGSKIGEYFDEIIISGDIGIGKPDLKIFEMILDSLNVRPDEAIMIGNSLNSDIKGAQSAGIKAVWVNREGISRDDSIIPDYEISSLDDLNNILRDYK